MFPSRFSPSHFRLGLLVLWSAAAPAFAAEPTVTKTTWRNFEAYRLTDGKTEAIVVPELGGRMLHYGRVGGRNFLWNGQAGAERGADALMWGGDKTYIGPHTMWRFTQGGMWPPPLAPNATAHEATILEGGRLRTTSPVWPGYDTRVVREMGFDANGDLVCTHSFAKTSGANSTPGAVWVITQAIPTDSVFVPLDPKSPYKENVYWFGGQPSKEELGATVLSPSLLKIRPTTGTVFKLGASPKRPALAAVKDGVAFVQRADAQEGQYPEGADQAGMSVEVYHAKFPGPDEYTELELLSPLRRLDQGATLTTRWSLKDVPADPTPEQVERLLSGE